MRDTRWWPSARTFQAGILGAIPRCSTTERSLKVRRLLREQEQAGALPAALTISRDAKSRCRPGPQPDSESGRRFIAARDSEHPNLGHPSCRTWEVHSAFVSRSFRTGNRVASIAVMQRSLKPQSTGQHRGDPPFYAGVAQQRQQQFRKLPGKLPHESASLSAGSISGMD